MDLDDALIRARNRYVDAHEQSRRVAERAAEVLPGGNTRSVLHIDPFAFRVTGADGPYLRTMDGQRYLDLLGDYSAGLLGHGHETVADAVRSRLDAGWGFGAMSGAETAFAEAVVRRFASIEQVRFTNSGTEANLMAIQTARHATGRDRIVVFAGGYHGGVLYFGPGGDAIRAPFEYAVLEYNDIDGLKRELTDHGDRIACVLVEPMLGASGCIPADPAFLRTVVEGGKAAGAIVIFDEVMTSRLAVGGAQQLTGLTPDMTTLGKYLAGGLSFGAFGGRRDLMAAYDPAHGGLSHGGTFNNNAFTMAAGIAVNDMVGTGDQLSCLSERGDRLRARLQQVVDMSPLDFTVTGWGSLNAIHPVAGPVRSPRDLVAADTRWRDLLFYDLLAAGYYIAPRGYFALSFAIDDQQLEGFIAAVAAFCDRYETTR